MSAHATRRARREAHRRRWSPVNVSVAVLILAGASLIAYPSTATWFSDVAHASTVSGYVNAVDGATPDELAGLLGAAHDYNDRLPGGPLRDPFVLNSDGGAVDAEDGRADYLTQLSLHANTPMARIRIPGTAVDLPIYHGTDEATLERGIGHLYGSGLPVGGKGTHAVLTGHSGIPGATLFTRLHELEIGDQFVVDVAGEHLTYRVDQVKTVLPDDGGDLRSVDGKDYVTLLTCTPTGVNTHRLLVRGVRVGQATSAQAAQALPASQLTPEIPWGAMAILAVGVGGAVMVAFPRSKRVDGAAATPRRASGVER